MTAKPSRITVISSMATRLLLAELAATYTQATGQAVAIEAVGGLDAAKRVAAGEALDLVVLASAPLDKLIAAGHVRADGRADLARSLVAAAVRAGAPQPDIGSEAALRRAVLDAGSLCCSSGPSGDFVRQLLQRWGLADAVAGKLVQTPPGVPVGSLVARGEVELGFQQLGELLPLPGLTVLGTLPEPVACVTTFCAGLCTAGTQPDAVQEMLRFFTSPAADAAKRRHGMSPV